MHYITTGKVNTFKDAIFEYQSDASCQTLVYDQDKQIFLCSGINKLVFPGKTYTIPTGIKAWLPCDFIGLIVNSYLLNPKLQVIPQIVLDDCYICIQIRNTGILPVKILEEEILANLILIPKLECHIVSTKGQS